LKRKSSVNIAEKAKVPKSIVDNRTTQQNKYKIMSKGVMYTRKKDKTGKSTGKVSEVWNCHPDR